MSNINNHDEKIEEVSFSILPPEYSLPHKEHSLGLDQLPVIDVGLVSDRDARDRNTLYLLKTVSTRSDEPIVVAAGFYLDGSSRQASQLQAPPRTKPQNNGVKNQSKGRLVPYVRPQIVGPKRKNAEPPRRKPSDPLGKFALVALGISALSVVGLVTINVLLPAIQDPQSNLYASSLGYPARQRRLGHPIEVQSAKAAEQPLADPIAAQGESVALQEVAIRPLVSGTVNQVYVTEGQPVREGDPLFQIDPVPLQQKVELARIDLNAAQDRLQQLPQTQEEQLRSLDDAVDIAQRQLSVAQKQLDIQKQLQAKGAVSLVDILGAQETYLNRELDLAEAQQLRTQELLSSDEKLNAARLNVEGYQIELNEAVRTLEQASITASTAGLVSTVNINAGEVVSQGQTGLMTISQDIVFKAFIDQGQLDVIKVGDPTVVRLVAYPGRTFQGNVIRLNPTVETSPRRSGAPGENRQYTYPVWIKVKGLDMPSGLQGYAQFGAQKTSLVIPESSFVHLSAGEGMVLVAKNGQAVVRQVKVGRSYSSSREVLEGLNPGEEIVLYPQALKPGDQLKVFSTDV